MPSVALLGTRYPDLSVEESILVSAGVDVVRDDGNDVRAVRSADVIIAGSGVVFDAGALDLLDVRGIVRAGIGVDRVDLHAAAARGIRVSNVPDYGTESVAQHALALALAGTRRIVEATDLVRAGNWGFAALRPLHLPQALVAGVLGQGRIGARLAELFAAVGFGRVIGHDPFTQAPGVEQVSHEELLTQADVLSLHLPGSEVPVLGPAEIAALKPNSVLVNTARGSLIDESALARGLREGRPRVACLDVFASEPPGLEAFRDVEHRLILSPHQAWYTEQTQADLRRKSAEEALRIIRREERRYPMNHPEDPR